MYLWIDANMIVPSSVRVKSIALAPFTAASSSAVDDVMAFNNFMLIDDFEDLEKVGFETNV